jgi:hypothetical protein
MAVPVDNLTETGHVLAWMAEDGIRLHWVVGKFSKALGRWEDYDEALVRTWAESSAPDEAILVHEADLPEKAARSMAIIRDGRVIAAAAWRVSQWQAKVNAALDKADRIGGPRAMREALSATAPRLAHIERWASDLRALAWDGEGDEPLIPELGPFSEPHNFPANMSDKLTDWAEPGDLTTDQLTEDVIQKLTKAKRKKFTELLNVELAELQQERGGPHEDRKREGVIEATLGLFSRVGEM